MKSILETASQEKYQNLITTINQYVAKYKPDDPQLFDGPQTLAVLAQVKYARVVKNYNPEFGRLE
eukprot:6847549-Alexandrium_andersonii.AAC.1